MVNWKNKKVLVTGGAGFIGSHLAEGLLELGAVVSIADNFCRGKMENIAGFMDKIQLHQVDLTDPGKCLEVTEGIDCVFHLASAVGGIHFIKKANVDNLTPSVLMNTNMLEASARNGVEHFLFASSACIYRERTGSLNQFKEEEGYPAYPATTYGWAKILGEIGCQAYYRDYGLKTCSVRIFNCYGERENLDPKWSHVIPSLVRKAIRYPEEGFRVFGDGKQERAFLYVKDCVQGLILAMDKISDGGIINLGAKKVSSIKELAEAVVRFSGKEIKIEYDLSGPQGTHRYCADTAKMERVLGWQPEINLKKGLEGMFHWAKEELDMF